jgi:hypothetical protein
MWFHHSPKSETSNVHHEIVGPLLDIIVLQHEGVCAEMHFDEPVFYQRSGPEAQLRVEALADFKIFRRHHGPHCPDRVRQFPRLTRHDVALLLCQLRGKRGTVKIKPPPIVKNA